MRILEIEISDLLGPHHLAREVHQPEGKPVRLDIHPEKIPGVGFHPIKHGPSTPFVGFQAVDAFEQTAFLQLGDMLGDGRDAEIRLFCDVGNRELLFSEYLF